MIGEIEGYMCTPYLNFVHTDMNMELNMARVPQSVL